METEKFELMLDEAQANAALEKGMLYADTFVNKNYLINLDRYPLVELDSAEKSDEYIRLYQIERIVYDVDENANDKLISVYSAFFNIQAAGLLVIKSTRNALGFYIGVRSVDNTSTAEAILEKSFKGNFAGSQIQAIPQEEVQKVLGSINKSGRFGTRQNVSSVSIVPSTRDEDKERFVQGIEKFIDTMKGSEYTAVFIAEPLDKEILEQRKRGLQKIYSGLSPFASTQLSYGENYSKAVSKGMSENFSKTLNDSLTDTTSHFNSRSTSRSHGTSFGFLGIGFNNSTSTGYSSGSSWASAVTRGTSETKGETVTETDTDTTGDSRTITVTSENKSVKYILEKIDQHLARIKNCEAFGLWDIACYFVSENVQTSVVAASTYKALMAGFDSGVENSYVNVWKQDNTENTPALLEYLKDKDTLKRNLAVVINKVDIPTLEEKIGETAAQQYLAENAKTCKSYMDARDAVCRNFLEEYGAGNFVRTAEAKFKTVRYFTCSALGHNHEGQPYEGKNVVDPVMWLLQQADSSIKAE